MSTEEKLHIVCWSGGKDSTATIVLAHEHGLPIDLIIICLVWFDKKRRIYAEHPEVIEWILNYAIPLFESWGYKVKVLESEKDYIYWFNHIIEKSSCPERIGKRAGWLLRGKCCMNREKTRPVERFVRSLGDNCVQYIGIAIDEPERLDRAHSKNQESLLERYGIKEDDTYEILRPYNLISPTYNFSDRGGCWFCPNAKIRELAYTKQHYPELWRELVIFDNTDNKVSEFFKHNKTFKEINEAVDAYIATPRYEQLTLFDYIEEDIL